MAAAAADDVASPRDDDPTLTRTQAPAVDDITAHYVQHGAVQPKPTQPSRHHEFDYASKAWVLNVAAAWRAVRRQRDARLTACDWVVTRAQEAGEPVPEAWRAYRQALRDITEQADPCAIAWPEAPEA
ncbi:hypothetical protein CCO03_16910 [Comamonas serinivorans]|uniref:Phage tail assembly chaperone-like domain-containing protein n=1 Tax=Comamonas serinivorans TaxID=1082851 RepID=A0A1Y0EU91_9BURK|nr:hypothetical protein CCO03_16910 [Comamonas serinivorans]